MIILENDNINEIKTSFFNDFFSVKKMEKEMILYSSME